MKIRKGNSWQYNGYNSALSMPRPRFKPGQGTEITQAREVKLLKKKIRWKNLSHILLSSFKKTKKENLMAASEI